MIQILHQQRIQIKIKQVCSIFSLFYSSSATSHAHPPTTNNAHNVDSSSTHIFSGISNSVIRKCPHPLLKKTETGTSLKQFLLSLSKFSPKTVRKFWGFSELKPEHVLELLLGFEFNAGKFEIEVEKVGFLWGVFKWASEQGGGDFEHLHQSFHVMASMLGRVHLFKDVDFLFLSMEKQGVMLDNPDFFSALVEFYVGDRELEKAISIYRRMRGLGLVPSLSCYRDFINCLVGMSEVRLAYQVFVEMLERGFAEVGVYQNVVRGLCEAGLVQDARNVIKKAFGFGMVPTCSVLDAIACGYCEKKDYDDLLSLFSEMKCTPNVVTGNKILHSLCRDFGVEEAYVFLQELEHLGFFPDEVTFGILIGWSCREGKLRNAFLYLSEVLVRCLKPSIHSYNALISGLFKERLWKHAQDIVQEMEESGIPPEMSTFRVLLAGYCKARLFDEVKMTVGKMVDRSFIQLSSIEDPLSKAFMILGLDPSAVRVRRDNDVGFSKTEFFDSMGNGLYLETNVEEYEKTLLIILEDSMVPDYNSLVLKDDCLNDIRIAEATIGELVRWGQELSSGTFSTLLKRFYPFYDGVKQISILLEKMPKLYGQLDQECLNLLVQAYADKRLLNEAMRIYLVMVRRGIQVENKTYSSLIPRLCEEGTLHEAYACWELAQNSNWLPDLGDYKNVIYSLCRKEMVKEAFELFEQALLGYPHQFLVICHTLLENLCRHRFTGIARVLFEELLARGCALDRIAYNHLIRGFCQNKSFSEAFVLTDTMLSKNMAPDSDVSLLLIPQLCRKGYFDKATLLKDICSQDDASSLLSIQCALMGGFFDVGMPGKAVGLFQEMISKGTSLNAKLYNILVQGYCDNKNLWKFQEVFGAMMRRHISISIPSFRKVVSLMCMEGKFHSAFSIKDLMFIQMGSSPLTIYNILIFKLFTFGKSSLVDSLLREIREKNLRCDSVTFNYLVSGFSRCNAIFRSLQYLTTMMYEGFRPNNRCLRAVIRSYCSEGDFKEALKLSQEMERRDWVHCSTIQDKIVEGFLSCNKVHEAEKFLDRMFERGLIPGDINYDNLIKRFSSCGRNDKAIDLLDRMLKKGNVPNSTSYDYVIRGLCSCNRLGEALDLHTEMMARNLKPSIKTWDVLIQKFAENEQAAKAETLLHSLLRMGEVPSREMFVYVVSGHQFEHNLGKASELVSTMQRYGYEPDFETHWSLISNISKSSVNGKDKNRNNFLSRLLSESGFSQNDPKPCRGNQT